MDNENLVEATVRHGTVRVGPPEAPELVGPGGKVSLPAADVAALRHRGVLHDPDAPPAVDVGPTVTAEDDGPNITEPKTRRR